MARDIQKIAFDDDLMMSDDFEGKIPGKMGKGGGDSGEQEESSTGFRVPSLDDGELLPAQPFALDDFEAQFNELSESSKEMKPSDESSAVSVSPSTSSSVAASPSKETRRSVVKPKLILMATAGVFFLALAVFFSARLFQIFQTPKASRPITMMIKRSVPIPISLQEHQFLILADSENEKNLVTMALELKFYGQGGPVQTNEEELALRDSIYRFLSNEHPAKNSLRYWENIVKNDLSIYLRTYFPKRGLQSIRLTSFVRL